MHDSKYRHELKYVISTAQMQYLRSRISCVMHPDHHAGADGCYNIRSMYFDDYRNRCYYENENGTDPREKYRIRIYNHSADRINLECKRKERGKTQKISCGLTLNQANELIHQNCLSEMERLSPLQKRLTLEMRTRYLHPVVIVEYERIPFVYKNGNVRVTFDTQISSASNMAGFFFDELPKRPIMPVGQHLMEVKFDEYLPDFIYRSLNLGTLQQTAYSKYYLCRRFALQNGRYI